MSTLTDAHQPRQCRATSKRTGNQCHRYAIKGGFVCKFHGGGAPQVIAKAERRLREMVDPMIERLHQLAMQTDNLKVASECVRDALDRAGIGEMAKAKVRASKRQLNQPSSGVTVNIGFLAKTEPPAIDVNPLKPQHQLEAASEND